jgi:hypothetical protein
MSMPPLSVEEIYEQIVRSLSPAEQAQLLEKIARNLSHQLPASEPSERHDWMSVLRLTCWLERMHRHGCRATRSDEHRERK